MTVRTSFGGSWFAILIAATFATPACAGPSGKTSPMNAGIARGHKQLRLSPPPPAPVAARAQIAIIIDDLGEQQLGGQHALSLPGPVAMAFLPGARFTAAQAALAHQRGKEVLLHLPLQPGGDARAHPTALKVDTGHDQLREYFRAALDSVPYARGVNNHQGSLMTEQAQAMDWLMREVAQRPGLYFIDSRTSTGSLAYRAARAHGVPSAERNVFLDTLRGEAAVRASFHELIARAHRDDRALAIGHPYPETFRVLNEELPGLAARYGVRLVSPSELIARQSGWRAPNKQLKFSPVLTLAAAPGANAGGLNSYSTTPAAAPGASAGGPNSYSMTPATSTTAPALPAATSAAAH